MISERPAGDAAALFQQAVLARRQGDATAADACCETILRADARHVDAWHLRALIALQAGATVRGIEFLERALDIDQAQPLLHSNLGNAWLSAGEPARALESIERALNLDPQMTLALYNRGNALRALGRLEEALESYDAVLAREPAHGLAVHNRALTLRSLGRPAESAHGFAHAVALLPGFGAARDNWAAVLLELNRPDAALAALDAASPTIPPTALAGVIRGNALLALCRNNEALEAYSRALTADPQDLNARLKVDAGYGRAAALIALKRPALAAAACAEVLAKDPAHPAALGHLYQLRMAQCDWQDAHLAQRVHEVLRTTHQFVNPLAALMFDDPPLQLACARAWTAASYPPNDALGPCRRREPGCADLAGHEGRDRHGGALRVAYVSADFGNHPVAQLLVGALEQHDRRRVETIGVYLRAPRGEEGSFEARLRAAFDRTLDVSTLSDRDAAQALRDADIDIAVDLMGFTDGLRLGLFAHRSAPVQVGFLGYAGTVGAPYMDYLLADPVVIPEGCAPWYAEAVVRLPHCYLPTDDRRPVAAPPSRAAAGLPPDAQVLCAFTQPHKMNRELFEVWMRILRDAPKSVLWLRAVDPTVQANLSSFAASRGVEPERLKFAPRVAEHARHLARLALADLVLDTLPYNGHSTTCEALWVGVPVLTCAGRSFASRVAASALTAAGLPELITHNTPDYERRALELLSDSVRLRDLRSRLEREVRRSALFDTRAYTRGLEAAYAQMMRRARCGDPPVGFDVAEPSASP